MTSGNRRHIRIWPAAIMVWVLAASVEARPQQPRTEAVVAPTQVRFAGRPVARVRFQVLAAVAVAMDRLERLPECRRLFEPWPVDGVELLRETVFELARSPEHRAVCDRRRAAAFTRVGGRRTYLCPARFGELTRQRAAMFLIHEALHQAGLDEWPHGPEAPRSSEINLMVRRSCDL